MWPFKTKRDPTDALVKPSVPKRMDDIELELLELRDTQEKTLAAVKKIQGRLMARVKVEEAAEVTAQDPLEATNAMHLVPGGDLKAELRHRANQLRAQR